MPQHKNSIPWNKGKKGLQIAWNKGLKLNPIKEEIKQKMRETHKINQKTANEKNWQWKGENVSYRSLHEWIANKLGKPTTCEHCKKTNLKAQQIHWASKNGKYKRDLKNWIRLCVKCHKAYDKKNKKLKETYDKNKQKIN